MIEYYKTEWRVISGKNIRWFSGPCEDSYTAAVNHVKRMVESWKDFDVEFRVVHTRIEQTEHKKVTTEEYYPQENQYAAKD